MDANGNHLIKTMAKQNNPDSGKQMHIYSPLWNLDVNICMFIGYRTRKRIVRGEDRR